MGRDQKHSADVNDVDDPNNYLNQIKILEITIPREIYINPILTTPKDDENFSLSDLKAIEFKSGVTTVWDLEIKEIKLEKVGTANFSFNTPSAEGDITVTVKVGSTTISPGELIEVSGNQTVKFTAPNTYTSYVWKVNGEVQSETSNVFSLSTESLSNQIYNITLFADTDTVHHSWQTEISKS